MKRYWVDSLVADFNYQNNRKFIFRLLTTKQNILGK